MASHAMNRPGLAPCSPGQLRPLENARNEPTVQNAVWADSAAQIESDRMADISDRQLRAKQTCRLFSPMCA
jgi:hypothetical protein